MKFSCEKALLQSAIATASRATAPKSPIPALEGILLEAGSELRFTGYNLETGIRTTVPAEVGERGSLVLSARKFADVVGQLPDDVVTVTTEELTVHSRHRSRGIPRAARRGKPERPHPAPGDPV